MNKGFTYPSLRVNNVFAFVSRFLTIYTKSDKLL